MHKLFRNAFTLYASLLHRHPLAVKVVTSATLSFAGDVTAQALEHFYFKSKKKSKRSLDKGEEANKQIWAWDIQRTLSVACYGFVWGFAAHYWYLRLDIWAQKLFSGVFPRVAFKVAMDFAWFEPFSVLSFFIVVGTLEGKGWAKVKSKISDSLLPTIALDMCVWGGITSYVFYKIPVNWQVVTFAFMDFFYDSFLSIVQHNDVFREIRARVMKFSSSPTSSPPGSPSQSQSQSQSAVLDVRDPENPSSRPNH